MLDKELRIAAVLATAALAGACARPAMGPIGFTPGGETSSTASRPSTRPPAGAEVSDAEVVRAVLDAYRGDAGLEGSDVVVTSVDGDVRLGGQARNLLAKDRAVALAERVRGVRSVVASELTVASTDRSDADVAKDVRESIALDPIAQRSEIDVQAKSGVVSLRGTVTDARDRWLADELAKGVYGVRDIRDELRTTSAAPNDAQLKKIITQRLAADPMLGDTSLKVDADHGKVALSGSVSTAAARTDAERIARISGAGTVDSHALAVAWWNAPVAPMKKLADDDLRARLGTVLASDPRVPLQGVEVDVRQGRVRLRGSVDRVAEKRAAEQDVRRVPGVTDVDDVITLRGSGARDDEALAARVRKAILRDPFARASDIGVTTKDGVVTLRGVVDDELVRSRADEVATHVPGATGVLDELDLRDDHRAHDADQLRRDIEAQFAFTPTLDAKHIRVVIDGETVYLQGSVPADRDRALAEDAARHAGARVIVDDLQTE